MIPHRAYTATATGGFLDAKGTTGGPTLLSGWYVSETANSTAGVKLLDGYIAAPGAATAALVTIAGSVTNGAHLYKVTFITSDGETEAGTASNSVTTDGTHGKVTLSAIPTGPVGRCTARKIYRTEAAGSDYKLLTTIADNETTTYLDNTADGSLTTAAPSANTSAYTVAQWDLAAKGAQSAGFQPIEVVWAAKTTLHPVAQPLRIAVSSGAVRVTVFGR